MVFPHTTFIRRATHVFNQYAETGYHAAELLECRFEDGGHFEIRGGADATSDQRSDVHLYTKTSLTVGDLIAPFGSDVFPESDQEWLRVDRISNISNRRGNMQVYKAWLV